MSPDQFPNETTRRAARGVVWVAAAFCAVVAILIIATFVQLQLHEPLDSPAVESLLEELKNDSSNEALRKQIRAVDLLARKAYFTSRWQLATGGWLLLAGLLVLIPALKIAFPGSIKRPAAGARQAAALWSAAGSSRRIIITASSSLLVAAVAAGFLSHQKMGRMAGLAPGALGPSREQVLENWPNFRGPDGNGVATVQSAPTSWNGATGDGLAWKVTLPLPGYSSPVVWEDQLFLTGADRSTREVFAISTTTGDLLWRHPVTKLPGSPDKAPRIHNDTGYAPSSVAVDGRHVFAIFPTGDLVGLDLEGNRLWGRNLGPPDNHYGHSSSLMVHDGLLIVQYDQRSDARLYGLDVTTGADRWRVERSAVSWSSPIIVYTGSRWEIILTNSTSVDSYDPATGVKLWGIDCMGGEMGPSAAFANGMVFAANDYAETAGIRINADGAEKIWSYKEFLPDTASPVATAEHVFLATSYGAVICLDARTGAQIWQHDFDMGFYASPVLIGDLLYALDLDGIMHIFKAGPTFELIAENELGEPSSSTSAFVGDRIYLRGDEYLYCVTGESS